MAEDILLDIRNLRTNFYTYQGVVKALDGINLSIRRGETFGLVGETGCGKSVTANSILRLIPIPPGKIEGGSIYFSMPEEKRERLKELQERLKELKGLFSDEDVRTIQKYIKARRRATSKERVKNLTKSLTRDQREYIEAHREFNQLRSEYDILRYNNKRLLQTRGNLISMIFQEPMSSLNPVYTAGDQISESILLHEMQKVATMTVHKMDERKKQLKEFKRADKRATDTGEFQCSNCKTVIENGAETCPQCGSSFTSEPFRGFKRAMLRYYRKDCVRMAKNPRDPVLKLKSKIPLMRRYERYLREEALSWAEDMLHKVKIPDPANVIESYPHELSGGMQQRVTIAMALACKPQLLIADEPTTALDVTIQAQILKLMNDLQEEMQTSILLITHNLGVVAETCHRVGVMYAGTMAEIGPVDRIFNEPFHPYTQGLMASIPKVDEKINRLDIIPGNVPNLVRPPSGCRFNPRCPYAMGVCKKEKPPLIEVGKDHYVACHLYSEVS